MADYWIKAYIEILDDPKMATMPDRLWRRTMEIFLLAGKFSKDKSGVLPDTNQLAWVLRMSSDDLLMDLKQLQSIGIVEQIKNGWIVVNFAKRQAAASDAERKRQQREREQHNQYYGNVTEMSRNVRQINRLTESESESESDTENEQADPFDDTQHFLEKLTGVMPTGKKDFDAINEIIKMGAIKEDIQNGFDWMQSKDKYVRYFSSLVEPTRTAMLKRIQKKNGSGKQSHANPFPTDEELAEMVKSHDQVMAEEE